MSFWGLGQVATLLNKLALAGCGFNLKAQDGDVFHDLRIDRALRRDPRQSSCKPEERRQGSE